MFNQKKERWEQSDEAMERTGGINRGRNNG